MTTNELKQYIDKVLGNSIRCLLPSYWWRRIFNLTIDEIGATKSNVESLLIAVENLAKEKANVAFFTALPDNTTIVELPDGESVGFTIYGGKNAPKELEINMDLGANATGQTSTRQIVLFRGRTKLNLNNSVYWSNDTEPDIDLNALDDKSWYCFEVVTYPHKMMEGGGFSTAVATLRKCANDRFSYDSALTDASVGAPQTKAVKTYVDDKVAQSITNVINTEV